jgi:hypothetical protein
MLAQPLYGRNYKSNTFWTSDQIPVPISSIISSSDPEVLAYRYVSTVQGNKMWGHTASISEALTFSGSTPPSVVDEMVAARRMGLLSEHAKSVEDGTSIASVGRAPLDSWFLSPVKLPDEELESSTLGGLNGGNGSNGSLD